MVIRGKIPEPGSKIDIVGAGMSGLLAAYYAVKGGYRVRVFERDSRVGGLVRTEKKDYGLVEAGVQGLPLTEGWLSLSRTIGLEWCSTVTQERYILRNGRLRKWPLNFLENLNFLARVFFFYRPQKEMSLAEFARFFAGDAGVEYLASPILRGIYAVHPEELDLSAAFPILQKPGWLWLHVFRKNVGEKRLTAMSAPAGGMSELATKLFEWLQPRCDFRLGTRYAGSEVEPGRWTLICTDAGSTAEILRQRGDAKAAQKIVSALEVICYAPLTTMSCEVEGDSQLPEGLGFLVPRKESENILGVLFSSSMFPAKIFKPSSEGRRALWTFFLRGGWQPTNSELEKEWARICESLSIKILNSSVYHWQRALPVYNESLRKSWQVFEEEIKENALPIGLFGNYTGVVSLRRLEESARHAFGA